MGQPPGILAAHGAVVLCTVSTGFVPVEGSSGRLTIDTHVHLDAAAFAPDVAGVVRRAQAAGVERLITIGTNLASSRRAQALAHAYDGVWASVGVHPHEAAAATDALDAELLALAADERIVAIGETGLDFYRIYAPADAQREAFGRQVALAQRCGLPLVIHSRAADDEVVETLERKDARHVVMHCFSGDRALARRCVANGWYLAFGGAVTYPRNAELRAVVKELPADRLLFETDAPYLAPVPHRGRRNEPAWLPATVACCAAVRGVEGEAIGEQATQNALAIFTRLSGARIAEG